MVNSKSIRDGDAKRKKQNKTYTQKKETLKVKLSFFALLSLAVFKLETDNPSSKSVKTDGKTDGESQTDYSSKI